MINFISNALPILIIVESLLASMACFWVNKVGSGMYWFSTALITTSASILIKKYG